jgi:predicted subunit of tRNA(5-methylaminomethyl-2-thiouridylate) methyltransferase
MESRAFPGQTCGGVTSFNAILIQVIFCAFGILKDVKLAKPRGAEMAQQKVHRVFDDGNLNPAIVGSAAEMCYQDGTAAQA